MLGKSDLSPNETIIWNNKHIKINNTPVFFPTWFRKGVYKIKDLMSDNSKFLPFEVFSRSWFHVKACFTTYYSLCNSICQNFIISKESRTIEYLIDNWRTNSSNLSTANLLTGYR